jgi:GR25 family glycosyltransferase involved in LPS biosynthesis
METNITLPVAVIAFNRPQTTKSLINRLHEIPFSSIDFFFDFPHAESKNPNIEKAYTETLFIVNTWAKKQKKPVNIHLAEENLGGNQNTIRALIHMSRLYDLTLLLEDDVEWQNSFTQFLNDQLCLLPSNFYGISPYMHDHKGDCRSLLGPDLSAALIWNQLMGGSLGLIFSSLMVREFEHTVSNLNSDIQFRKLLESLRSLPLAFVRKAIFVQKLMGKYLMYVHMWGRGQSVEKKGPSWDGLMKFSVLIHKRKVLTPVHSLVYESENAQYEAQWHPHQPENCKKNPKIRKVYFDPSESSSTTIMNQSKSFVTSVTIKQFLVGVVLLIMPLRTVSIRIMNLLYKRRSSGLT